MINTIKNYEMYDFLIDLLPRDLDSNLIGMRGIQRMNVNPNGPLPNLNVVNGSEEVMQR